MMKKLLTLALAIVLGVAALPAKTFIVCVGIDHYQGKRADLRVCVDDARTIYGIFRGNDAECRRALLIDKNATIAGVKAMIKRLFAPATTDDAVIVFFSGHGVPGGLCCVDGVLPYDDLYAAMRACRAGRKMVLVDACFSGKMRKRFRQASNRYAKEDIMLFLSSRDKEMSMETNRLNPAKNSLFTRFLERGLRGAADSDHDRVVTAKELFRYVHDGVARASLNRQHPVMWGSFDGAMPIIAW